MDSDVQRLPSGTYDIFEPLVDNPKIPLAFYEAHNEITFYTWDETECCVPRGSTSATLLDQLAGGTDRILHLKPGDFLLFEEVRGAKTGVEEDATPAHRCIVRLKTVDNTVIDELNGTRVLEITWAIEDALPFPLCLSARGPAPDCQLIEQVSVARGNILLVDHGQSVSEDLGSVPLEKTVVQCDECENQATDVQLLAGPFKPYLKQSSLTYSQPLAHSAPASQLLIQQPRKAQSRVTLTSTPPPLDPGAAQGQASSARTTRALRRWTPVYDLLESNGQAFNFVVEVDNGGVAHLRFGDGELGRAPEALETFTARYRVGNGAVGNVGAESISTIVFRKNRVDGIELVCNPIAAQGGTDPEPLDEVKLLAPGAFSIDQERAITADDYARLAEKHPGVQRAIANFRWTGSGYDVLVAVDPLGTDQPDPALIRDVERFLAPYRRIGDDVTVVQAEYVPLDISLTVCVQPNYVSAHVKAALLDVFSSGIRQNGTPGFFHPDKLSFGDSIAMSELVAAAQAVTGVMSVTVDKLERLGEPSQEALQTGLLVIGPAEIAQVDNDPNYPERGQLILKMRGGR